MLFALPSWSARLTFLPWRIICLFRLIRPFRVNGFTFKGLSQMIASLNCEYDRSSLPVIMSFARACAQEAGADPDELNGFELATEEVAAHIVDSYLLRSAGDSFSIFCRSHDCGLEFSFEDKGLPIDVDKALSYDASSPERLPEGLRFHLARSVCDSFELRNQGKNGWMIVFSKSIKAFRLPAPMPHGEAADGKPKEKLEIVLGCKADIPAIMELNYYTFRYTNEPEYYTVEGLEDMMDNPYHVFNLVKTDSGKLVASQEYYVKPEKTVDIVWYGTIMTHPGYRDGGAVLKIFKNLKARIENPPHPDVKFWFQSIVTSHSSSQRFADMLGASTCAIDLSQEREMDFSGDIKNIGQRESFLLSWRWLSRFKNSFSAKLHCPPEHESIIRRIFSWQGILLEADTSLAPELPSGEEPGCFDLDFCLESEGYVLIHADSLPGSREEFGALLRRRKDEACARGAKTVGLHLPSDRPLPAYLSKSLKEHGFFFSGIVPKSASEFKLQYLCLGGQSFDFGKPQLYAQTTIELFDYIKGEYGKV